MQVVGERRPHKSLVLKRRHRAGAGLHQHVRPRRATTVGTAVGTARAEQAGDAGAAVDQRPCRRLCELSHGRPVSDLGIRTGGKGAMIEIWVQWDRSNHGGDPSYATACAACAREFIAGRRMLPSSAGFCQGFGIDDLVAARRVAIRPACAFGFEPCPEDLRLLAGSQPVQCDLCMSWKEVDHRERVLHVARHLDDFAASGEGRRPPAKVLCVTGLPWWFDYFVTCVSLIHLFPAFAETLASDWNCRQKASLARALRKRESHRRRRPWSPRCAGSIRA